MLLDFVVQKAMKTPANVLLPESGDDRVLKAGARALKERIARISFVGNKEVILQRARQLRIDLSKAEFFEWSSFSKFDVDDFARQYAQLNKKRGVFLEQAKSELKTPLTFGALLVKNGFADAMVAGSVAETREVIRAALMVGVKNPSQKVSSYFLMQTPHKEMGEQGALFFADCAVIPRPSAEELADIALQTAEAVQQTFGVEPRVAMLSFSTFSSADHELVQKVQNATRILKAKRPSLKVDGEIQVDAAIVPEVALRKGDTMLKGKANVLIFPDLHAGNISYKLVERLAGAQAVGPILLNVSKPVHDLSRGCSEEDIFYSIALASASLK